MVMGILDRGGVNVGPDGCLARSVENPGGFYEVKETHNYVYKHYYDHMNPFKPMWSFEKLRALKSERPELISILENRFGGKYPIAIKTMDCAALPSFENDEEYDIRVLWVHRKIADQARSIARMWADKSPPDVYWCDWLTKRYAWFETFRKEFDFKYLDVDFNAVLDDPRAEGERILRFCDLEVKGLDEIEKWVNPAFSRSRA